MVLALLRLPYVPVSLLAGAVAFLIFELSVMPPQADDAYISYRYARHLVEGHGLVYNVGEYVEGITNLLWTLIVAGGMALGTSPELVTHVVGIACSVVTLVSAFVLAREGLPRELAFLSGVVPWVLVAAPGIVYWTSSGLETPLVIALATGALLAIDRQSCVWVTSLLVASVLTRPDSVLLVAAVYGAWLLRVVKDGGPLGPLVVSSGTVAVVIAALTGFRLLYYGDPLPNTFYAKVGGIPMSYGVDYLFLYIASGAGLLLVPAAIGAWAGRSMAGVFYVLLTVGYVIYIGGDAFGLSRFLLPTLPFIASVACRGVGWTWRRDRSSAAILAASFPAAIVFFWLGSAAAWWVVGIYAAVLAGVGLGGVRPRRISAMLAAVALGVAGFLCFRSVPLRYGGGLPMGIAVESREELVERNRRFDRLVGNKIQQDVANLEERARAQPVELVAAVGIGRLGYLSRLPILDLVGLVDPEIARRSNEAGDAFLLPGHQRSNPEYVLARRPDVIFINAKTPRLATERQLIAHPRFDREYIYLEELGAFVPVDPEVSQ